ncbi:MAG: hypothetical protein JO322_09695 [Candidatus Eremiobacteraeota bacterium]|nr:hypothetical protein [Candidatus Eremiobacteraeota bacterium]
MQYSDLRVAVAFIAGALWLAACSGGSTPPPLTPVAQAVHSKQQSATKTACAAQPLPDFKPSLARERPAASTCGIQVTHESVTTPQRAASPEHFAGSSGVTTFDVPGAATAAECEAFELFFDCGTQIGALNNGGSSTGFYLNKMLVAVGFVRNPDGTFRTFQVPGADFAHAGSTPTVLTGDGFVGGYYLDANFVAHGFMRSPFGSTVRFSVPYASSIPNAPFSQGNDLASMNAQLNAAGHWYDAKGNPHAYIRFRDGTFTQVIPPDAMTAGVCETDCYNNAGALVGNYVNSSNDFWGFIRNANGSITVIPEPGAGGTVFGISDGGTVVGSFVDAKNVTWAYLRSASGKFKIFQEPNASATPGKGTEALQISGNGAVAGIYVDAHGDEYAFYRSPSGHFDEFFPHGTVATFPGAVNDARQVAGVWYDAAGQSHGFIWTRQF